MGWLWGSSDSQSKQDPYQNLDPELRKFLDKESPNNHSPAQPETSPLPASSASSRPPNTASTQYRDQLGIKVDNVASPSSSQQSTTQNGPPTAPAESLFPDGRYAHLWKNYKPLSEIEAGQTDQDRMASVIEAYHERRAQIGRAAVENCVLEQIAEHDCFRRGGWEAKVNMCRTDSKAFNRCYTMQSRFLKALGYLSSSASSAEEDERVQMHADKLYHDMLERERLTFAAKEEGRSAPVFRPLLDIEGVTSSSSSSSVGASAVTTGQEKQKTGLDIFVPERRQEIEASLKGKTDAERELEISLLVAEARSTEEVSRKVGEYYEEDRAKRAERRQSGRETLADTIKRLAGW